MHPIACFGVQDLERNVGSSVHAFAVTMRCLTRRSLIRQSFSRDCDNDGKKLIILWPHAHRPIAAQQTESLPQVSASGGEVPTASSGWTLTAPDTSLHELVGH